MASINSEAGIIASLIKNPELSFYSEDLLPAHFSDEDNRYLYQAICELARQGITNIDAYNLFEILGSAAWAKAYSSKADIPMLQELIQNAQFLARSTVEEYKMLVSTVIECAFRRDIYKRLRDCEGMCMDENVDEIQRRVYAELDEVMTQYSSTDDIIPYKDLIEPCWEEIKSRQQDGYAGIPFPFPTLNEYVTMERGELVIFAAKAKTGKSMMLLNVAMDLLKKDYSVLYIDSELNSRLFTARVLSNLTGIEFKRLTAGTYSEEESQRIDAAISYIKSRKFTHLYVPMFDQQTMYTAIKKVYHTQGIDVLIIDYFKGTNDESAWDAYAELGKTVDMIKNQVAGAMNICAVGAAQATESGKIADSQKIGRNASSIAIIEDKTPEEIEQDGEECGNKKLRVILNRNGMQHAAGEYIDFDFQGNFCRYREAKQHIPTNPY